MTTCETKKKQEDRCYLVIFAAECYGQKRLNKTPACVCDTIVTWAKQKNKNEYACCPSKQGAVWVESIYACMQVYMHLCAYLSQLTILRSIDYEEVGGHTQALHLWVHVCMYVCMYACMYGYTCTYVILYMYTYIYILALVFMCVNTASTAIHTRRRDWTLMYVCICIYT